MENAEHAVQMSDCQDPKYAEYLDQHFYSPQDDEMKDLRELISTVRQFRNLLLKGSELPSKDFIKKIDETST